MHQFGQRLVTQGRVNLQALQQAQVNGIQVGQVHGNRLVKSEFLIQIANQFEIIVLSKNCMKF
jgi:hypothetical protein